MDRATLRITILIASLSICTSRLPSDILPISSIATQNAAITELTGVHGIVQVKKDFYIILMNEVYKWHINPYGVGSSRNELQEVIKWSSTTTVSNLCKQKTQSDDACNNFIRVFSPKNEEALEFIVCGTNSFQPSCRNYVKTNTTFVKKNEFSGTSVCPYDPEHTGASLYADGNLYSGTVADFLGRKPVIYRYADDNISKSLERTKRDPTWLSDPWFVRLVDAGPKVLIFFTEIAVEDNSELKYSRVAQVCKNDEGGEHILRKQFTSFQKARLNCSFPGQPPFYFNELGAVTELVTLPGSPGTKILFAAMNTPQNSIWGSAVCAYLFNDIEESFNKPFLEQNVGSDGTTYWSKTEGGDSVKNALNKCLYNDENAGTKFPTDEDLLFIRSHPFKSDSVPSWSGDRLKSLPLFMKLNALYRFSAITVETNAGSTGSQVVILIGTTDGRILKVVPKLTDAESYEESFLFVGENQVYDKTLCSKKNTEQESHVQSIKVDRESGFILVSFANCVVSIPMCSVVSTCQRACIAAQDPYCAWDGNKCVPVMRPEGLEQDILNGDVSGLSPCPVAKTEGTVNISEVDPGLTDDGVTEKISLEKTVQPNIPVLKTTTHLSNVTAVSVASALSAFITPASIGFVIGMVVVLLIILIYCGCKKSRDRNRGKMEVIDQEHDNNLKHSAKMKNSSSKNSNHNSNQEYYDKNKNNEKIQTERVNNISSPKKEAPEEKARTRKSESSMGSGKDLTDKGVYNRQPSRESQPEAVNVPQEKMSPQMQKQHIYASSAPDHIFYRTYSVGNPGPPVMPMPGNPQGRGNRRLQRNLSLQIPPNHDGSMDHPPFFSNTTPATYRLPNHMEVFNRKPNVMESPSVTMPSWQPMYVNTQMPVKTLKEPGRQYQTTSLDRKSVKPRSFNHAQLAHPNDVQTQGRNYSDTYSSPAKDDKGASRKRYQSEGGRAPPLYAMKQPAYSSIEEENLPLMEQEQVGNDYGQDMMARPTHLSLMNDQDIPYSNQGTPMNESHPYYTKPQHQMVGYTLPSHLHRQPSSPVKQKNPFFMQPRNTFEDKHSKSNPATPEWDDDHNMFFASGSNSSSNVRDRNPSGKSQGTPSSPTKRFPEYDQSSQNPRETPDKKQTHGMNDAMMFKKPNTPNNRKNMKTTVQNEKIQSPSGTVM